MARTMFLGASLILSAFLLAGCCCGDADVTYKDDGTPVGTRDNDRPSKSSAGDKVAEPPARGEPVDGGKLNKFFPGASVDGHDRVFTKEKDGFAEAVLKKDGKEVATLTINDTASNPSARSKFDKASEKVQGHPVMEFGKRGSTALVADRFQVKVTSSSLGHDERKAWIGKFDLSGLSGLK